MKNFIQLVEDKLNNLMWTLIVNGLILVILAVLIAWSTLLFQLLAALSVLVVAYCFFYLAYRIKSIKKLMK